MSTSPDSLIAQLEAEGQYEDLAAVLLDQLESTEGRAQRVALYERIAGLFEQRLDNPGNALLVLLQALSETPDEVRLLPTLARLAPLCDEWDTVLDAAEVALAGLDPRASATLTLHRTLADWYAQRERTEDAGRHLAWIFKADPADVPNRLAYASWLEAKGDHDALVAIDRAELDAATDPRERKRLSLRVARTLETRLKRPGEALEVLGQLYLETHDDGLELHLDALADQAQAHQLLARVYRRALDRPSLDPTLAVGLRLKVASLYLDHLGDTRRASDQYAHALMIEPDNVRALAALRTLFTAEGRFAELANVLEREAESGADRDTRFERYLSLGDLYRDQLQNDAAAVEAWFKALDARSDDRGVLARLLGVYSDSQRWEASIKVLRRLSNIETNPTRKAQYLYAVGVIQRDKVADHYVAVRTFDKALEADPTLVKAFQAIDEILTHDGDYARQDRYYRKMLVRAREHQLDDALVVSLARNLGEINRSRLNNYPEAIKAYQIVARKRPEDRHAQSILAELSGLVGSPLEAVRHAFRLFELDPTDPEGLHELARRQLNAGQMDGAWCACQALMVLGQANDEERRFYEEGRRHQSAQARRPLEPQDWTLLTWAGKPEALDQIFVLAWRAFGAQMVPPPKALGLNPKRDLLDLEAQSSLGQLMKYAQQVVGVQVPAAWRWAGGSGMAVAPVDPPGVLIGDDMASYGFGEAVARAGRTLYLSSVQHLAAQVDNDPLRARARVLAVLAAAVKRVSPQAPVEADPGLVDAFGRLSAGDAAALERAVGRLDTDMDTLVDRWLVGTEQTANRLGLLLCCDLSLAVRMVRAEPAPRALPDVGDRLRALLVFAVSEPFLELRRRLGYALAERTA